MSVTRPNGVEQSRNDVVDEPYIFNKAWDQETFEDRNYDKIEYHKQSNSWGLYRWRKDDIYENMQTGHEDSITLDEFMNEVNR